MPGTRTKYLSLRIVVDADDEKLCGREACPMFSAVPLVGPLDRRACTCGAFRESLNWPPPVRRCYGCLAAKEL